MEPKPRNFVIIYVKDGQADLFQTLALDAYTAIRNFESQSYSKDVKTFTLFMSTSDRFNLQFINRYEFTAPARQWVSRTLEFNGMD